MIYFIILGVIIALFLKRNPLSIVKVELKGAMVMVGCLVIQVILAFFSLRWEKQFPVILNATFITILISLALNWRLQGIKWIFTGALLNSIALMIHGGLMPVSDTSMKLAGLENMNFNTDSRHQLLEDSLFWWLGDWIPVITPIGTNFVFSPGDLLVGFGIMLFIIYHSSGRGVTE